MRWDIGKWGKMLAVEDNLTTISWRTGISNSPHNLWVTGPPAPRASWKEPHHMGGCAPSEDTKRFVSTTSYHRGRASCTGMLSQLDRPVLLRWGTSQKINEAETLKIPIGAILRLNVSLICTLLTFFISLFVSLEIIKIKELKTSWLKKYLLILLRQFIYNFRGLFTHMQ